MASSKLIRAFGAWIENRSGPIIIAAQSRGTDLSWVRARVSDWKSLLCSFTECGVGFSRGGGTLLPEPLVYA